MPRLGYAYTLIIPPAFAATVNPCPPEMSMIPGGKFTMGSDNSAYIEELSAQEVTVSSFCIDKYEVTNSQFAEFVKATGYVTVAERPLSKEQFPDVPDEQRLPGSLVFAIAQPGAKQLSWSPVFAY
ncbi:MAG: formylglycine-generating enzyme family protein [Aulosira sp. ZfuVER01]|nr:SUMF1/EgtB/PvdO family nonheme iron enzyme [Aulosira sp. ZfuVER01]MDZ7999808.1 SUMF1/EgtB/PvdO family nonheme iron enzyme [Aulosira sp. DedVER01a]MDZ8053847.1 SUMF1/EgtB/PvdO family nonheme iron enzyme [Aulosira sp. ZfuCHP01]